MKIKNLSYSYEAAGRKIEVFKDLDFDFGKTGLVMILGKSGCGKSTLLSLLCGMLKPQKGEIVSDLGRPSMVFQDANLIEELTLEENACLPLTMKGVDERRRRKAIEPLLTLLNIQDLKDKKAKDLSGGEKMRASLARALASDPKVLLADEPTGALDKENATVVMDRIKEVSQKILVVCVTHNEELADRYGDTVLLFERGKLEIKKQTELKEINPYEEKTKEGQIKTVDSLRITSSLFRKKGPRLMVTSLALGFAFSSLVVAFSIRQNKGAIGDGIAQGFHDYRVLHASEVTTIKQSNGMTLAKNLPLSPELLEEIQARHPIEAYPSLSFFIPDFSQGYVGEEKMSFQIQPSFFSDQVKDDGYVSVIANDSFLKLFKKKIGEVVTVKGEGRTLVPLENGETLYFEHNWNLRIIGQHQEIEGFSTPCLLYDYPQVSSIIKALEVKDSFDDYLEIASDPKFKEDSLQGFETILKVDDALKLDRIKEREFKDRLKLESRGLAARKSANMILNSITQIASIFLLLATVVAFFIELFSLSTLMKENKRNYAISLAFSPHKGSFVKLYYGAPILFASSSLVCYGMCTWLLYKLVPKLLKSFEYPNFLAGGLTMSSVMLMGFSIILLTVLASYMSYRSLTKKELLLSLRSER